jgi:uncharacterized membrane protein YphA (DoxX/SURF4 family)
MTNDLHQMRCCTNPSKPELQDDAAVDTALLVVRVVVGIIFVAHGAQQLFGVFDGPGLANMVQMMEPIGYEKRRDTNMPTKAGTITNPVLA